MDLIITEKCVFQVDSEKGLTLIEVADGYTPDDIVKHTGAPINVNISNILFFIRNFQIFIFLDF